MNSSDLVAIVKNYVLVSDASIFSIEGPENPVELTTISTRWHPNESQRCTVNINDGDSRIEIRKSCGFQNIEHILIDFLIDKFNSLISSNADQVISVESIARSIQTLSICKAILYKIFGTTDNRQDELHALEQCILMLESWSSQTYEGNSITFSVCFDYTQDANEETNLQDYTYADFLKVITNGITTSLLCDKKSNIFGHITHTHAENRNSNSPICFLNISNWTERRKIAITLTRQGEILIFHNKEIIFAKRRDRWILFIHTHNMQNLGFANQGFDQETKAAIYQTALDVSFRRTGGCIGFINSDSEQLIPPQALLSSTEGKSKFLSLAVNGKLFHEIDRALRAELVAIDGATVVFRDGTVITTGAILNIANERITAGGGRTIAAINLAKYGFGIKISNDGKIQCWKGTPPNLVAEIG